MSYYSADEVRLLAQNNWLHILNALAPNLRASLKNAGKHVPCPCHGGKDGFRLFKDANRTGGGVCNTCGTFHDGFQLLMWVNDWSFKYCLDQVASELGAPDKTSSQKTTVKNQQPKKLPEKKSDSPQWIQNKAMELDAGLNSNYNSIDKLERLWAECVSFSSYVTEPMRAYFASRGLLISVSDMEKSDCLRFHPSLPYYSDKKETGKFPAIVCAIRDVNGNLVTLHRTYLSKNGKKAKVEDVKKMMSIPKDKSSSGAAIRLGYPQDGILGIAEGLETALSVYRITQIPTWSTVNARMMESFDVPEGIHTVLIWADKDKSMTGERSANVLKSRLESKGIQVHVLLPKIPIPSNKKGVDWNDVLISQGYTGFPRVKYLREFIQRRRVEYGYN